MLEPRELLPIDNVHKIALTIELMGPLAARQYLDRLSNMFVASRNLVLDAEGIRRSRGVQPSHNGSRSIGSQRSPYPSTQSPSVRNLSDSLKFVVIHLDLLLWKSSLRNHRGDPMVLGFYYGSSSRDSVHYSIHSSLSAQGKWRLWWSRC
jgi:hypothetical protein